MTAKLVTNNFLEMICTQYLHITYSSFKKVSIGLEPFMFLLEDILTVQVKAEYVISNSICETVFQVF